MQAHIQFIKKQNRMNESIRDRHIPKKENYRQETEDNEYRQEKEEKEEKEDKIVVIDDVDDLDKELANEYRELENNI